MKHFFNAIKSIRGIEHFRSEIAYLEELHNRTKRIEDLREEMNGLEKEKNETKRQVDGYKMILDSKLKELDAMNKKIYLEEVGFNKFSSENLTTERYKPLLEKNLASQKKLVQEKNAVVITEVFIVDNSEKEGEKLQKDNATFLIRAFNNETENIMNKLTFSNYVVTKDKLQKSYTTLNKLNVRNGIQLNGKYLQFILEELNLRYKLNIAKENEKEQLRIIREEERERKAIEKEIAEKEKQLNEEKKNAIKQLELLQAEIEREAAIKAAEKERELQRIAILEEAERDKELTRLALLEESEREKSTLIAEMKKMQDSIMLIDKKKEENKNYNEIGKSGYVYIISNKGVYGENVFKIGMTRRLEPLDRIRELSGASVPFPFDIHALILSDDAPQLESTLHREFNDYRVNLVNNKKEFFEISIEKLRNKIIEYSPDCVFNNNYEAEQYIETLKRKESLKFQ